MKKIIFGTIAITVVLLVAYVISNYIKKIKEQAAQKADEGAAPVDAIPVVGGGNSLSVGAGSWPIQYKKYNENAKPLQIALGVDADGIIGPVTLRQWQKYNPEVGISTIIPNQTALNGYLQNIADKRKKQPANTPPFVFAIPPNPQPWQ